MEKFEDQAFLIEATQEPGCRITLNVHVKPEQAKKYYKKGVKKVNKQISLPGFRKGKAPDATVISRYGSHVESEWKEILIQEAFGAALDLTKTYPINKDSIEKPKLNTCSQEEGASLTFVYEHYPKVPEIEFSTLSIPTFEKKTVTQEEIDDVIKQVQKSLADFEEITDRPIEAGDYVDLTITAIDHEPPSKIAEDRRFSIEEEVMAPWMIALLVGKKGGDVVEEMSATDPKMSEEEKANFKPTKVRIEIHSIQRILLPEVNDELAKQAGAESQEDLIEKITKNLENKAEAEVKEKQIEALEEALIASYPFEIPQSLVERERQRRIRERIRQLKLRKVDDEEIKKREQEIEEEVATDVDKGMRYYFIHKQIERQGNISLSNEELNRALIEQIISNPQLREKIEGKEREEFVSNMRERLLERKALDYALSQALAAG